MPYDEELARMRAQMLANQDDEPPVFDDGARYLGQDPNMMPVGLFGRPKKPVAPPTAPPVNLQRRSILGLTPMPAELPAVVPPAQPKPTPQQIEQAVKPQATFPGPHPEVWAGGPFMSMGDLGDVIKRHLENRKPWVPPSERVAEPTPTPAEPSASPLQSLADKALNAPMSRRDVLKRAGQAALQQVVPMPSITDVVPEVVSPLAEAATNAVPEFVANKYIDTHLRDFVRSNAANAFEQEPGAVAVTLWSAMKDALQDKLPKSTFDKYEGLASDIKYEDARDYDSSDLSYELFTYMQKHMKDLKPHELMEILDYLHMDSYDAQDVHGMLLDHYEPAPPSSSYVDKKNKELGLKPAKAKPKATFGSKVSPLEFENYLDASWAHSQASKEPKPKSKSKDK